MLLYKNKNKIFTVNILSFFTNDILLIEFYDNLILVDE